MAMVCPQCRTTYEQRVQCPVCSSRLLYWDPRGAGARRFPGLGAFHRSTPGRMVVGLLLAQGLFYGLGNLVKGILLASGGEELVQQWFSDSFNGLLLFQALMLGPLFLGAMFAGSSSTSGATVGLLVGGWNGLLCVLVTKMPGQSASPVALYGQPVIQAFVGLMAGWMGSQIWMPLPPALQVPGSRAIRRPVLRTRYDFFAGKIAWFRVIVGTVIGVLGSLFASGILQAGLAASGGHLRTQYELQDKIVTWEIKALAMIFGAALAGATTRNGIKQGVIVGLAAACILSGILMNNPATATLDLVGLTFVSSLSLAVVGGWFGGQLFPPILVNHRSTRGLGPSA